MLSWLYHTCPGNSAEHPKAEVRACEIVVRWHAGHNCQRSCRTTRRYCINISSSEFLSCEDKVIDMQYSGKSKGKRKAVTSMPALYTQGSRPLGPTWPISQGILQVYGGQKGGISPCPLLSNRTDRLATNKTCLTGAKVHFGNHKSKSVRPNSAPVSSNPHPCAISTQTLYDLRLSRQWLWRMSSSEI
jgi:ribosomal protein L28